MDAIVREFIIESADNLDRLDRDLVALEEDCTNPETIARIFRVIHTIKGTTGFLSFPKLESLAHAGENLLSGVRDGEIEVSPAISSALIALVYSARAILESIETHGGEGEADFTDLIEKLSSLRTPEPASHAASTADGRGQNGGARAASPFEPPDVSTPRIPLGQLLMEAGLVTEREVQQALAQQADGDPRHVGEILIDQGIVKSADIASALQAQKDSAATSHLGGSVRVDVGELDKLTSLVGELALARAQIIDYASQNRCGLSGVPQRLNAITSGLEESVMRLRLQPVAIIFGRVPRVVRDLAASCHKLIRVEVEGAEMDLDRTLIEAIKDPITHMVRNAVDHGIEPPEERVAAGKPAEGCLRLRALEENRQAVIEVSDDGEGINFEKVKQKALEKGFITSAQAASLKEWEAIPLLFQAGLSTATSVTNVSGRGVGMDVVKTKIEEIGGSVDVYSERGKGTTFRIRIALARRSEDVEAKHGD
ncbi:MAG: ATP-binding protein [Terriglobia bacterium]